MGWLETVAGWLKLSPKYLLPVLLVCAVLLLSPEAALQQLGVVDLVAEHRMWIGLLGLASAALLLSHFAFWMKDKVQERLSTRRFKATGMKYLRGLTTPEKRTLALFIAQGTRSQNLDFESGVTNGLEHQGVIYKATSIGSWRTGLAYNMQPWAWDALNDDPSLVEPELTQVRAELEQMRASRY